MTYIIPIASLVFILDRLTKILALKALLGGREIRVLPEAFHLTLVLNKGAAFGLFSRMTPILILFATISIFCIIVYLGRKRATDTLQATGLAMILGGALGNLTDRLFYGYVIDFIDLRIWPVFNVADSFITIGAAVLIINMLLSQKSKT